MNSSDDSSRQPTTEDTTSLFRSDSLSAAEHIKLLLTFAEFRAAVLERNPWRIGAAVVDVVVQVGERKRALEVLRELSERQGMPDWDCACCGEENPATFDICWQCGSIDEQSANRDHTVAKELAILTS